MSREVISQPNSLDRLDVRAILRNLEDALRRAGVQRDDPTMPLFEVIAHIVRFIDERSNVSDRVMTDATQRVANAIGNAHHAAAIEIGHFRAELAALEAQTSGRFGDQIARDAKQAFMDRLELLQWQTILIVAFLLCGSLLGSYFFGRWYGSDSGQAQAEASIHETETHLQAAFRDGHKDAETWRTLMESNDITVALQSCADQNLVFFVNGRRACNVPLWLDPLPPTPPFQPVHLRPGQ